MGTGKDHIRLPRLRKTNIMYSLLCRCLLLMFMYVYLCESGYRDQTTREGPMMGAGKALREKHHRVIQHKPEEYGSWHVTSRWFQWGWDTGMWERGENWPQVKKI